MNSPARPTKQATEARNDWGAASRFPPLLSHSNPTGDLAVVAERAVDLLLADLEKKRFGRTALPRRSRAVSLGAVSRASRRAVFERDGERCSFVSADRRRCSARAFLQLDHAEPRALGGSGDTTNVRVLCAAHNRWRAEQTFGKAHVEAKIHFRQRRQRKCESDQTYTKLLSGLTGLYFRPKPARAALDLMQSGGSQVAWTDPMDSLLVAAIQLLTK